MMMKYKELFVERFGTSKDAFMITNKLLDIFPINSYIYADIDNIRISTYKKNTPISKIITSYIPNYITINGIFINKDTNSNEINHNNILGDNSIYYCNTESIEIPTIECTNELLHFYNCRLIYFGEVFQIENKNEMPLFEIDIGEKYKDNYLLKEGLGDGFYMEIHDTPHLHQPSNQFSNGYIVLGKRYKNSIILSKVRIPFGNILYIPSNVYHSDSLLIGTYNVLYTKTVHYQTFIFKTFDNKIVFIE